MTHRRMNSHGGRSPGLTAPIVVCLSLPSALHFPLVGIILKD